ncbi:MAG TPA: hypothetical protein VF813_05420, partial [Anaerolineaceae bacterium]
MKILVASSDPAFGELLRASLAENDRYIVHLVRTGSEVLTKAASNEYVLAILDADLPGQPFVPLVRSLMAALPGMRLMVIPPENNPQHPALSGLTPDGYVYSPFYLPDLLEAVHRLLASGPAHQMGEEHAPLVVGRAIDGPEPNWTEDAGQADQQLAGLLEKTPAQGAWIAFEGKVWAHAGQLSRAAAQEVIESLASRWEPRQSLDLARYVRLETTGAQHLVIATRLLDELVLALAFSANASFTQAHGLAHHIAAELVKTITAANEADTSQQAEEPAALQRSSADLGEDLYGDEAPGIDLSMLLAGMPSPDPDGKPLFDSSGWAPEMEPADVPEEDLPEWFAVFQSSLENAAPA